MKTEVLIKATKVEGIYDKDPKLFTDAVKYDTIKYNDAIAKGLKIMDTEAFAICQRYEMPITVLDFFKKDNLLNAVLNKNVGTKVIP
jgi:uridylate kinase